MNKPKLTFDNLMIEVTRRCNMKCAHCLRGDAQNIDIDYRYIDDLLDQVEVIGFLEITGGEPTLNLDAIKYILNGLCKRGIPLLGFSLFTNGLIYSEELIEIAKLSKKIIDISCENCISEKYGKYNPATAIERCNIGISLDRYHEQHDICMKHYQKYKSVLSNYADVRMIMRGNRPSKVGRAKNLQEAIDIDFKYTLSQKQRIELLSKDFVPICPNYRTYHMFHENQKIICCRICMDVYGNLFNGGGNQWDWESDDLYPKICKTSDPIWHSLIEYNKGKIPCAQFQKLQLKTAQKEMSAEQTLNWLNTPDAIDEPKYSLKALNGEDDKRHERLDNPKSLFEAFNNFIETYNRYIAYISVKRIMQSSLGPDNEDWEQIAAGAAYHSYYDGDERGAIKSANHIESLNSIEPLEPLDQNDIAQIMSILMDKDKRSAIKRIFKDKDTFGAIMRMKKEKNRLDKKMSALKSKTKPAAITNDDNIRCYFCGKVIQSEGRNIHCAPVKGGLQCQYCKKVNVIGKEK